MMNELPRLSARVDGERRLFLADILREAGRARPGWEFRVAAVALAALAVSVVMLAVLTHIPG